MDIPKENIKEIFMDAKMLLEIWGYIGSILVVVSMLMSSIVKLRVINTIGSVISGISQM